jgi:hypothetical protein
MRAFDIAPRMTAMEQARERQQATREQIAWSIVIGGTPKGCGLDLGPSKDGSSESGNWKPAQRRTIFIGKKHLPKPPAKRTAYTCNGVRFSVD